MVFNGSLLENVDWPNQINGIMDRLITRAITMDKIIMGLKSRTVWTVILMVVINGVSSVQSELPVNSLPYVNAVLGILAAYFRVNPKQ